MAPPKNTVGWLDWQVVLAMIVLIILLVCSVYYDLKILEYFAAIPAVYGVARTFL